MQVVGAISYEILKEIGIGEGRNSKVYLADEPQLGGQVAVKEIDKASFGMAPANYFQEAQAMYQTTHDNVVPIQYACETLTGISLVMPYYSNGSLAKRIADRPLQLREVLRIAQGILAGLTHIHLNGLVHFDVKPSNVLFSDGNVPMVSDFGQSRSLSATGVALAPRLYVTAFPPEAMSGVGTVLSDIYQVGVLLYRALNGNPFFVSQVPRDTAALTAAIVSGKFPDRRRFMPHVPSRIQTLVRKALRVNPADRFQSSTEMADALGRVSLPLNWLTVPLPGDGWRWVSQRSGYADIVVELTSQAGVWAVQTFTENGGLARRAKGRLANWRRGLTLDAAYAHLRAVFQRLPE